MLRVSHCISLYSGLHDLYITLRVQVPNNHILTQKLYCKFLSPKSQEPNYWVHGPLGSGSPKLARRKQGRTSSWQGVRTCNPHKIPPHYMVLSLNGGTLIQTPKYYNPYYGDPQNSTPNFGEPPYSLTPY